MVEQEPTSRVSPGSPKHVRDGRIDASRADVPGDEEAAAIIAVLSLMRTDAPLEANTPRASAWARAGRREAVRPWPGKE